MSEMTDWQDGKPCDRHDLAFCADCRSSAKIVRRNDGTLGYAGDCAVMTYAEVTGASYEESLTALRAAGYIPGRGTPSLTGLETAFSAIGFKVTRSSLDPQSALAASRSGRIFIVSGYKGKKGHSWSIIDGKANRPYYPPYRYILQEVTA